MPFLKLQEDATPHPRKWWHLPFLILLFVATIFIIRQQQAPKTDSSAASPWPATSRRQAEGAVFGTFYHITYQSPTDLQAGIDSTLNAIDLSLSPFNPRSVITAINDNTSTATDARFREVFRLAAQVSADTGGAFDITVAPLVNLWGFGFRDSSRPDSATIDSLRQFVGFRKVTLDGDHIRKQDARVMLDCSAIAKGYGVDAVGRYLEQQGVSDYMVEIGGEVRLKGHNPDAAVWHIGISRAEDDSLQTDEGLQAVLEVTDISMATSGNYRNFYINNGHKYAHTIDPRTGCPVQHSLLSATVLAPRCAEADAYATAFMVMGLDSARAVLDRHSELQAFLIYADHNGNTHIWHSPRLPLLQ